MAGEKERCGHQKSVGQWEEQLNNKPSRNKGSLSFKNCLGLDLSLFHKFVFYKHFIDKFIMTEMFNLNSI